MFLHNTVTWVFYMSLRRKDGRAHIGPGKMSKYFMISVLIRSALHMTSRALGLTRLAGLLGLMSLVAACGGGSAGSSSGGGGGGGGGGGAPNE